MKNDFSRCRSKFLNAPLTEYFMIYAAGIFYDIRRRR